MGEGLICLPKPLAKRQQQLLLKTGNGVSQESEIAAANHQEGHGRLGDDRRGAGLSIDKRQFSYKVPGGKLSDLLATHLHSRLAVDDDKRFQPVLTLLGQNRSLASAVGVGVLGNGVELALAKAAK